MGAARLGQANPTPRGIGWHLLGLLGLVFLLISCGDGEERTSLSPLPIVTPALEHEVIDALLTLYPEAMRQEDIDRLAELLQLEVTSSRARTGPLWRTPRQEENGVLMSAELFLEEIAETFRVLAITDLQVEEPLEIATDLRGIMFNEVVSIEDPDRFLQQTWVFRTTLQLTLDMTGEVPTLRITGVRREGPLITVTIPGQVLAGALARVMVTTSAESAPPAEVTVEVPETGEVRRLGSTEGVFHGAFMPPLQSPSQPLQVRIRADDGAERIFQHRYRLRVPGEGVVLKIDGTGQTVFRAVTVAPDGTVTGGGREGKFGATLYQVLPDATTACLVGSPFLGSNPESRVEDLAYDALSRLHTIVFDPGSEDPEGPRAIIGDFVLDAEDIDGDRFILCPLENPNIQRTLCQTVNAFAPDQDYPFRVQGRTTGSSDLSPVTRVVAAGDGNVWLFGSDGGVALVTDNFRERHCLPPNMRMVEYRPVFRRAEGRQFDPEESLLSNSVPAFVLGSNGSLGFGTALGFTWLQNGRFTPVPFQRAIFVPQDIATFEAFFEQVARAIFEARPLVTERIRGVPLGEFFGEGLVKEDIVLSAVEEIRQDEEEPSRFWLGTLGGGLRRLEPSGEELRDTLLLTRAQVEQVEPVSGERTVIGRPGIISNIIIAMAMDAEQTLWAATDEGVSRVHLGDETVTITNFSPLDGLRLAVRDVAVDRAGIVWLATDGGLFQIREHGGQVQGIVLDTAGNPVVAADVLLLETPFRTVTDTTGQFHLANLPLGMHRLHIDGQLADRGPFTSTERLIDVMEEAQTLEPLIVMRMTGTKTKTDKMWKARHAMYTRRGR
jgi:hypothetical protein